MMTNRTTSHIAQPSDAEKLAAFRAKRMAQKEADRKRLANEFPLLFGSTAEARSTKGKYVTKTIKTPSKGRSSVMNDENQLNASNGVITPSKGLRASKAGLVSARSSTASTNNHHTNHHKAQQVEKKATNKKSSFLSMPSFSRKKQQSVTVVFKSPQGNGVEMEDFAAKRPSFSEMPNSEIDGYEANTVIDPKVQEILDFLLENQEVDEKTHRRLSRESIGIQDLRRLSDKQHGGKRSIGSKRTSDQNSIFSSPVATSVATTEHVTNAEETVDESAAVVEEVVFALIEATTEAAVDTSVEAQHVETEPIESSSEKTTIDAEVENFVEDIVVKEDVVVVSETAVEIEDIYTSESNMSKESKEDIEIGDVDILNALRTYIHTLDHKIRSSTEPKPVEYVSLNEEFLNANRENQAVMSTEGRRSSMSTILSIEPGQGSQRASLITSDNVPVTDEYVSHAVGDKDAIAEETAAKVEKVIVFPRTMLLEDALSRGLVMTDIINRIQCDSHVKYVVDVLVSKVFPFHETNCMLTNKCLLVVYLDHAYARSTIRIC